MDFGSCGVSRVKQQSATGNNTTHGTTVKVTNGCSNGSYAPSENGGLSKSESNNQVRVRRKSPSILKNGLNIFDRLASLKEEEEHHLHSDSGILDPEDQRSDSSSAGIINSCLQHNHSYHENHTKSSSVANNHQKHNNQSCEASASGDKRSSMSGTVSFWIRISRYFLSLRPHTFCPSLTSVAMGAALAYKSSGIFSPVIFIVTCLTVLAVHGAGNLVNTYYDYIRGFDRKTGSEDRTLVDHKLTIDEVVHLGVFAYTFGCFGFVCLVFLSAARMEHLALAYFCGLSCSFLYTGGIGLKYIGLGDLIILIIFGPMSLLFSHMAQSGSVDLATIAYAIPLALNTEAILHSNNSRDMESDQKAGAVNLAILIGPTFSHVLYALLLFIPYIMFIVISLHYSSYFFLPLITLPKAFDLEKKFRSGNLKDIPKQTATLNLYFCTFYIISCLMTDPAKLPFLSLKY